jgi:primase-polymerase (primpol)-like protein
MQCAEGLLRDGGTGGVGVMFCNISDQLALCGVDLDTCLNESGEPADWASDIAERFNSYTEVSPSESGWKVFFALAVADLSVARAMLGGQGGKEWKRRTGKDHPPGIELYVSHRFFTTTFQRVEAYPAELRQVDIATLQWLIT